MTDLVDPDEIERIVGARRHPIHHLARAVSSEQTVYILHSQRCKDSGIDLRACDFSLALDNGIREHEWVEDETTLVTTLHGTLLPLGQRSGSTPIRQPKSAEERAAFLRRVGVDLLPPSAITDGGAS